MKTTYREILKKQPCIESVNKVLQYHGFNEVDSIDEIPKDIDLNQEVSFLQLLEFLGIQDTVWCIRVLDYNDYCLFLADVAEMVLPIYEKYCPRDNRPRKCIEAIRLYHADKITDSELLAARNAASDAARNAARNAASDAARNAARNAASDAAWDAARNAAWAAASDAASDAAWAAAWDAAWAAASDAASDAAWAAARAAAWDAATDAAWAEIKKIFRRHFENNI